MKLYSTVLKQAQAEQIIEKSRFIAYVSPVSYTHLTLPTICSV